MAMTIETVTKGLSREEWLGLRKKGIGGSDVAAIAGLNRYKSPIMVYLEKIGELEGPEENDAMYWGNVLEGVVAQEFSKRTGLKVQRKNALLRHPEHDFMLANVDRLIVGKREGLECKTANEYKKGEWDGDNVPWEYAIQCHHYMLVTGYDAWWIAVLIGGNKFTYKRIERDEEIIQYLIKIETDFWTHVENKLPPAIDASEASSALLSTMFPAAEPDSRVDLPPTAEHWIRQYDEAYADEKAAEERKNEAANQLKAMLETSETGYWQDRKVSWKTVVSNRLDSKGLQKAHPDIYEKFAKPSESRRFTIS